MASQVFTVATLGGASAAAVRKIFAAWEMATEKDSEEVNPVVDLFCEGLRAHRHELSFLYYCEWIDRWLFGDDVSDSKWHCGRRFCVSCISADEAKSLSDRPCQHLEHEWVSQRLLEASKAQSPLAKDAVIVVVREVISGSATEDEVEDALSGVPEWLNSENTGV